MRGIGPLALLLLASIAWPGEERFPGDPTLPWESIGLYIGIDDYPHAPVLDGCVRDMEMLRNLLRDRFGVRRWALLRNAEATRAGIGEACRASCGR